MPVGLMLESMSHHELSYWMILQSIDPIGEQRADLRHAIGVSAIVNTQVTKRKDLTQPKDYLAGEMLRKHYEISAKKRGIKPEWNAKEWWGRLLKMTKG